jgi:hypothetical protein
MFDAGDVIPGALLEDTILSSILTPEQDSQNSPHEESTPAASSHKMLQRSTSERDVSIERRLARESAKTMQRKGSLTSIKPSKSRHIPSPVSLNVFDADMHSPVLNNAYIFGVANPPMIRMPGAPSLTRIVPSGTFPANGASFMNECPPTIESDGNPSSKNGSNEKNDMHLDDFFLSTVTANDSLRRTEGTMHSSSLPVAPCISMLDVLNTALPTDLNFPPTCDGLQFSPADDSDGSKEMQTGDALMQYSLSETANQSLVHKQSFPTHSFRPIDGYLPCVSDPTSPFGEQVNQASCTMSLMDIFQIEGDHAIQAPEWPKKEHETQPSPLLGGRRADCHPVVHELDPQTGADSLGTIKEGHGMPCKPPDLPSYPKRPCHGPPWASAARKGALKSLSAQTSSGVARVKSLPKQCKKAQLRSRVSEMEMLKPGHPVQPSRFCHICLRRAERVALLSCGNSHKGICRKVVCEKCFDVFGWNWGEACALKDNWICTHCRDE